MRRQRRPRAWLPSRRRQAARQMGTLGEARARARGGSCARRVCCAPRVLRVRRGPLQGAAPCLALSAARPPFFHCLPGWLHAEARCSLSRLTCCARPCRPDHRRGSAGQEEGSGAGLAAGGGAGEEAGVAEEEAEALREQLHDKLLPVVLALLRVGRLSGAWRLARARAHALVRGLCL